MTSFADKPTLVGERVLLRPLVASDAEHMWADLDDAEATRLTGTHTVFTRAQIERWCATRADHDDRLDLAVVERATDRWAGEVVVHELDVENRSCGLRIALAAHARDRGLGTQAVRLVVDHIFGAVDDPPIHRIGLEVYAFNPRARAVYERIGFVHEGTRRDALRWDGAFVDTLVMGLLRPEWDAHGAPPAGVG